MDFIQEPLNKFLNYLKVKIKSLEAKFYLFGISVIAFSTILILNRQNNIITLVILSAGIMLFCLGFMFWCYSLLKMRWIMNTAKIFLILLNIPIYLISEFLSRFIIAQTLNLPVKDFELTLKALTSIFYIPVGVFLSCFILMVFAFLVMFFGMLVETITSSLPKFKYKFKFIYLCRLFGVISIVSIINSVSGNIIIQNTPLIIKTIKNIAFYGDYQEMRKYPTIKEGERVILHENGVISVASKINNEIVIDVRKIE
ncbi:hypothetical protein UNSWCD_733 [Campylobacter concisus UNSWCD]|uniref:hypothetical protein n=1 Tax=Campylobacter concisus TaxID=199 RepID=UPI00025A6988|nr:hypothetical protein [Campylobacter concisus]EIF06829.1 hypothetical protein UNSWCD_733 [Campylobacter concisus UNSWCD]